MGNTQQTFWQEITQGFSKFFAYILLISMGVMAKLAFDSRTQTLNTRQIIIKTVLSIFVGILTAILCENNGMEKLGKVLVPVATLIGEGIVVWIMNNWRNVIVNWLPSWAQNIFKKK